MSFTPVSAAGIGNGTKKTAGAASGLGGAALRLPFVAGFGYSTTESASTIDLISKSGDTPDGWELASGAFIGASPTGITSVAFDPSGGFVVACSTQGDPLTVAKRGTDNTFEAIASAVDVQPAAAPESCSFSPDGQLLAVGLTAAPWIEIYSHSGGSLHLISGGVAGAPAVKHWRMAWSPDGTHLAVGLVGFPHIAIYKRSGLTLSKLPNPATLPGFTGGQVATGESWPIWTPDGAYLLCGSYLGGSTKAIYQRSGDTFTAVTRGAWSSAFGGLLGGCWSPDGRHLYQGTTDWPYIRTFTYDAGTFILEGALQLSDPLPGEVYAVTYADLPAPAGAMLDQLVVSHFNSPRLTIINLDISQRPTTTAKTFLMPTYAIQSSGAAQTVLPPTPAAQQPVRASSGAASAAHPPAGIGTGA